MSDDKRKPLPVNVVASSEPIDFAAWCDRYIAAVAKLAEQDLAAEKKPNDAR